MQRNGQIWLKSDERLAFERYLRTGKVTPEFRLEKLEAKFNPWHDSENGRFTFAGQGTYFSRGTAGTQPSGRTVQSQDRRPATPLSSLSRSSPSQTAASTRPNTDNSASERPYLSSLHNEVLRTAGRYPPQRGTKEWTADDIVKWKLGGENIFDFKNQWVHGYRDAINAAAKRFDLPPELVAGVAFNEVGGDPLEIDNIAYSLRSGAARDKTSFGNVSIQIRRAAEALGYDMHSELTETQRRMVIASLEQPQANIFVAAKHLSDLRDIDFRGVTAPKMTKEQAEVIATRYNRGPDQSIRQIQQNLSYGRAITKRWTY